MADTYHSTQQNQNFTPGGAGDAPLEKDFENGNGSYAEHLPTTMDPDTALRKVQTAGSISISPELFEKIYLSPQNKVAGNLRKTLGNPTPFGLAGFLLSLTPLACDLMGWRGAGGNGAASIGVFWSFGGILMILAAIGEWVLGNTFPQVVFGTFGAFWLAFGLTLYPLSGAISNYDNTPGPTGSLVVNGVKSVGFNASFAFFLLFMGLLCLIFSVCALRTNLFLFLIVFLLVPSFCCLAGAFWHLAEGNEATAANLVVAGGALTFVVDMCGWYLFTAIMLASLDFPFQLPVVDLSQIVKGASEKSRAKEEYSA